MQHLHTCSLKLKDPEMAQKYEESQRMRIFKTLILMIILRLIRIIYVTVVLARADDKEHDHIEPNFIIFNYGLLGV